MFEIVLSYIFGEEFLALLYCDVPFFISPHDPDISYYDAETKEIENGQGSSEE